MIDQIKPFTMFAHCEVVYDGRASSTLEPGNYLIIYKPDQSLSIHGACFAKPLNYQNGGTKLEEFKSGATFDDMWTNLFTKRPKSIIVAKNKLETIIIGIHAIVHSQVIEGWTDAKIKLTRSERDLVNQVFNRLDEYFPGIDISLAELEASTPYGNVDILLIDTSGIRYVVEAKRKIVSVAGCGQVARYANYYTGIGLTVKQFVVGPSISRNAIDYCAQNGQTWVQATFD